MSDEQDPNGPDIRNLRAMRPFVRGAARGLAQKTIGGKGSKMALPLRPTRICRVCGKGFEFIRSSDDILLKHDAPCETCAENLKQGYTAFICDNRFCFGKSPKLEDMAGQIVTIAPHVMNALEGKFKIEKRFATPDGNGKDSISE